MTPRDLHLRIGRIVVEAPAGTDRHALARELAAGLPAALRRQLAGPAHGAVAADSGATDLSGRLAAAVAPHVAPHLEQP